MNGNLHFPKGGLGPVGLITARWAQIRGASRVIGIDWVPERLALAKNTLKIETINYKEQDTLKTLAEMVPGILLHQLIYEYLFICIR